MFGDYAFCTIKISPIPFRVKTEVFHRVLFVQIRDDDLGD